MAQESSALLGQLAQKESIARSSADELSQALNLRARSLAETARRAVRRRKAPRTLRATIASSAAPKSSRSKRCRRRRCNAAIRAPPNGSTPRGSANSRGSPRSCRCTGGWERAVETALGDYLEALCVDELDAVADVLPSLPVGRVSLLQAGGHMDADGSSHMLSGVVSGPSAIVRLLSRVRLAETLADALLRSPASSPTTNRSSRARASG